MSVSSTSVKIQYTGDGSTTNFSFPFNLLTDLNAGVTILPTDVVVYFGAAGSEVVQSSSNYSVNGPYGSPANTVVFNSAPAVSTLITIERSKPQTQGSRFIDGQPFPASSFELALDKLTMLVQQLQEQVNRSAVLYPASTKGPLHIKDPTASQYLQWDSTGTIIQSVSGVVASPSISPVIISGLTTYTVPVGNVSLMVTVPTSGDCAVNLPAATGTGNAVTVTKADSNGHRAAVTPNGTDTINGVNAADYIGTQWASITYRDQGIGTWVKQ